MTARREDRGARSATAALQTLASLQQAGVRQLGKPRTAETQRRRETQTGKPANKPAAHDSTSTPRSLFHESAAEPDDSLEAIRAEVAACTRCGELASARTQTVFGVGNPRARLCFLGEAPGADEDAQGEPFVGRAGQLLTRIIEACTLARADVYILNVLKCRPPGNRNPQPVEVANCRGFLDRQLAQIQPEFICCLGSIAAQTLLETTESIGRMRRRFFQYGAIRVMCTYHPAYLLRNPAAKKDVWDDMKMLMAEMGIELKAEGKRQKAE